MRVLSLVGDYQIAKKFELVHEAPEHYLRYIQMNLKIPSVANNSFVIKKEFI